MGKSQIDRRAFLKLAALGLGGLSMRSLPRLAWLEEFPASEYLGRIVVGKVDLKQGPDADSATVGTLFEDAVFPWIREVPGTNLYRFNQNWVETPEGYVWAPYVQPVMNVPNQPLDNLPSTGLGTGMWAEVTVPYVDLVMANPPARSPWLKDAIFPRLYYSQILWVDDIKVDEAGKKWYRVNEKFGYGDIFWADAAGFRPIDPVELEPINPEVEDKRIEVDITHQTLSCFEGNREVYFCRISSGAKFDANGNEVDNWATPVGLLRIWRKLISTHMSGGTTGGGYDLPGIGWTTLFSGTGVAIHSTFWHNDYGVPRSHGCVNCKPDDAKWIFRWTQPYVDYDPGDVTVSMPGGTKINVIES